MKFQLLSMKIQLLMWEFFLDISKAFDKVWHDRIIFKLKACGAKCELLSLLKIYLENREQRVDFNGQNLSEEKKCLEFHKDPY